MDKPKVNNQGTCIVERGDNDPLLVMLPDGEIRATINQKGAARICNEWFKRHAQHDKVNVGVIEWRHGTHPRKQEIRT